MFNINFNLTIYISNIIIDMINFVSFWTKLSIKKIVVKNKKMILLLNKHNFDINLEEQGIVSQSLLSWKMLLKSQNKQSSIVSQSELGCPYIPENIQQIGLNYLHNLIVTYHSYPSLYIATSK